LNCEWPGNARDGLDRFGGAAVSAERVKAILFFALFFKITTKAG
jgi:hypothetical protein